MRPEYQKYQQIDDYLNNKLSGEEVKEFERKMQEDPLFREEVMDLKLTNEVILEHRFFQIADTLDPSLVGAGGASSQVVSSTVKKILGIGGGSVAVVASLVYLNYKNEPEKTDHAVAPVAIEQENTMEQEEVTVVVEDSGIAISDIQEPANKEIVRVQEEAKPVKVDKAESKSYDKTDASYLIKIPLDTVITEIHHFNLDKTDKWYIPSIGANVVLKIFDKSGLEVYRKEFASN
ncbi:MAG TPA: hypothetical protein VIK89_13765, partial [Cytophagaceae bacterium]